jgi:hypothetical protein
MHKPLRSRFRTCVALLTCLRKSGHSTNSRSLTRKKRPSQNSLRASEVRDDGEEEEKAHRPFGPGEARGTQKTRYAQDRLKPVLPGGFAGPS